MEELELTPERAKAIETACKEWLGHGLSTQPANFDAAEKAITALYAAIDKPKPYFVRLNSPLAAELYINLLTKTWPEIKTDQLRVQLRGQLGDQLGDQLRGQLWDQLRGQLGDQLRGQLRGQLGVQLRGQLRGQLGVQLRDQLWDQLRVQLRGQLRGQLWDQLRVQLRGQLRGQLGDQLRGQLRVQLRGQLRDQRLYYMGTWFHGQWDYYWMWLETGQRLGVTYEPRQAAMLEAHTTINRSCGWWYPFDQFCIITDRPSQILRENNNLHSEVGPALAYRDGTKYYSWHGTMVPAHWIEERETLDPTEVLRTKNVEQRAAGAAIIGWPKMADKLSRKVIDGDPDTDIGALVELTLPGLPEPGRFLMALCPRNGTICEGVPYQSDIDGLPINTAIAAQAWRDGLPAAKYDHPLVRT